MIEQVLNPRNLQYALKRVKSNKGSAGIDGMKTGELTEYFSKDKMSIITSIKRAEYLPHPILGVEIPKGNGKTRLLGIPSVLDRFLQQAVAQILMPKYEGGFSENSYGFRPNKSARQAAGKALEYIHEGNNHIVDIDLKQFFDEVEHCYLLNLLYQRVKCSITLRLIRKWIQAPIQVNGKLAKRRKGIPQGSPISPLLANILLNELDKELTKRRLKFVRYADDFSIYTQTRSEANRQMKAISNFLNTKLKLKVNEQKSGIRKPVQMQMLGFGFVPTYKKGDRGKYQLVVIEKAWKRLKQSLKTITRKTTPMSFDERIARINEVQRGWLTYFKGTSIYGKLKHLDGWLRNRLRYCIWHHWRAERKENVLWTFLANEPA